MEKYAYIRIKDDKEDKHLSALKEHGLPEDHIFTDKESLKDAEGPSYRHMKQLLQQGDLLYIRTLDDLGSNYPVILSRWDELTKTIGVDVAVMEMPLIDTRMCKDLMGNYTRDLVSQFLVYLTESKYKTRKARQRECIDAALAKGVHFGRQSKAVPDNFSDNVQKWKNGTLTLNEAAKASSMPTSTFYRKALISKFLKSENGGSSEIIEEKNSQKENLYLALWIKVS